MSRKLKSDRMMEPKIPTFLKHSESCPKHGNIFAKYNHFSTASYCTTDSEIEEMCPIHKTRTKKLDERSIVSKNTPSGFTLKPTSDKYLNRDEAFWNTWKPTQTEKPIPILQLNTQCSGTQTVVKTETKGINTEEIKELEETQVSEIDIRSSLESMTSRLQVCPVAENIIYPVELKTSEGFHLKQNLPVETKFASNKEVLIPIEEVKTPILDSNSNITGSTNIPLEPVVSKVADKLRELNKQYGEGLFLSGNTFKSNNIHSKINSSKVLPMSGLSPIKKFKSISIK